MLINIEIAFTYLHTETKQISIAFSSHKLKYVPLVFLKKQIDLIEKVSQKAGKTVPGIRWGELEGEVGGYEPAHARR